MPLALILIAIGLILAGVRGKYKELGSLLVGDFTGSGNFLNWLVAIGIIGCVGYVPALQRWSRLFIVLVMLAMFLEQGDGLFAKFVSSIQGAQGTASDPSPGNPNASSTGGSFLGQLGQALGIPSSVTTALPSLTNPPTGNPTSPLLGAAPNSMQANPSGALNGATATVPNPMTGDPGIIPGL